MTSAVLSRRDLFRAPALFLGRRKARKKHQDTRLYHGPIRLPESVVMLSGAADVYRTTCRHPAIRLSHAGIVYLWREWGLGRDYIGEVVRTAAGGYRVHLWRVTSRIGLDVQEIISRDRERVAADAP